MSYIAKGTALAAGVLAVLMVVPVTALLLMMGAGFAVRRRNPWEPQPPKR